MYRAWILRSTLFGIRRFCTLLCHMEFCRKGIGRNKNQRVYLHDPKLNNCCFYNSMIQQEILKRIACCIIWQAHFQSLLSYVPQPWQLICSGKMGALFSSAHNFAVFSRSAWSSWTIAKGVTTCGACSDMETCQMLGVMLSNNPEILKNLKG